VPEPDPAGNGTDCRRQDSAQHNTASQQLTLISMGSSALFCAATGTLCCELTSAVLSSAAGVLQGLSLGMAGSSSGAVPGVSDSVAALLEDVNHEVMACHTSSASMSFRNVGSMATRRIGS